MTRHAAGVILGFLAAAAAHLSACIFGEADDIAAARAALAALPGQCVPVTASVDSDLLILCWVLRALLHRVAASIR